MSTAVQHEAVVRAMLAAAGVSVPDDDLALLVADYPTLRATADALYALRLDDVAPDPAWPLPPGPGIDPVGHAAAPERAPVWPSIAAAADALRSGEVSSRELTTELLERAAAANDTLGAYVQLCEESALAAADAADRAFAAGEVAGPLHGIPLAIKDIISTKDAPTTANSRVLSGWGGGVDAPVVVRLRTAGAVVLGKATTHEFAIGRPDPSTGFRIARNPWDPEHSPAGSSSGSAVAVAAGLALGAVGTDTGGSVRAPAAANGVTGLKVTFGRVAKTGVYPLAYSLDSVGLIARTAHDCALLLQAMAGHDVSDPSSSDAPIPDYAAHLCGHTTGLRIGLPAPYFFTAPALTDEVRDGVRAAVAALQQSGATVREVDVADAGPAALANDVLLFGEAFAVHRAALNRGWSDYGRQTRRSLVRGGLYLAADYVQAQRVRAAFRRAVAEVLRDVDVLVMPAAPTPAPLLDAFNPAEFLMFCGPWNLAGLPAVAVPVGFSATGLPIAMQIVGRPFAEATLLRVADAYQRRCSWHLQVPPVASALRPAVLFGAEGRRS